MQQIQEVVVGVLGLRPSWRSMVFVKVVHFVRLDFLGCVARVSGSIIERDQGQDTLLGTFEESVLNVVQAIECGELYEARHPLGNGISVPIGVETKPGRHRLTSSVDETIPNVIDYLPTF